MSVENQEKGTEEQTNPVSAKRRVAYYYDPNIGNYSFGKHHPMKPQRIQVTKSLVSAYDLDKEMDIFYENSIPYGELLRFHTDDYVNYLRIAALPNNPISGEQFNICQDNPIFVGLDDYIRSYTTGSIAGARRLIENQSDIVINWSGGMHSAKKSEASGFSYVNDVVLAILELLKKFSRVLYIDLDFHHGDGVEEAFYTTSRVLTMSFHKFGDVFPGTGSALDVGFGEGKGYAVNFPLDSGVDDADYLFVFKPIVAKAVEVFQPEAIVLQCGADSLAGDRIGTFNLSMKGHGECVKFVRSLDKPLLVLGGGGYTIRNVVRCWTYETAILLEKEISDELPATDYSDYFLPSSSLFLDVTNMENKNDRTVLQQQLDLVLAQLDELRELIAES